MDTFEKLLGECRSAVERFVRYKIQNRFDADDVLQETYLAAYKNYEALHDKASFKPWILRIAGNKCNDYYRVKANDMNIPLDLLSESALVIGSRGRTEKTVVGDTLDKLGEIEKQILYLHYFKSLPVSEIARRLAIPVGTVKSRLYYAKQDFKKHYPYPPKIYDRKGESNMKKMPEKMPSYTITEAKEAAFSVEFRELPNWFIVPKLGESVSWGSYDRPTGKRSESVRTDVTAPAVIHGVEGVEIRTTTNWGGEAQDHIYYAQLTDSHCRWLGELYTKNGVRHILTFLDGDEFIAEWGYGEENCGREIHLSAKGKITRKGSVITSVEKKQLWDIVGRYDVELNGKRYDTVCLTEISNGILTEAYIDQNGRTVLWRRFNRDDWAYERYGKTWSEKLPDSERLNVNGTTYVHWYDCITDYVL